MPDIVVSGQALSVSYKSFSAFVRLCVFFFELPLRLFCLDLEIWGLVGDFFFSVGFFVAVR